MAWITHRNTGQNNNNGIDKTRCMAWITHGSAGLRQGHRQDRKRETRSRARHCPFSVLPFLQATCTDGTTVCACDSLLFTGQPIVLLWSQICLTVDVDFMLFSLRTGKKSEKYTRKHQSHIFMNLSWQIQKQTTI